MRKEDVYSLYSLVKTLEELENKEDAVLLIGKAFLVPSVLAIHPENRALEPKEFLKLLR